MSEDQIRAYIFYFIIQMLQFQIVAVIFYLTFNSPIYKKIKQKSFGFIGNIRGTIIKKKPFLFITIGFFFNWIYVIFSALIYWGKSPLLKSSGFNFSEEDISFYETLAFSFNIMNTYCFLLQSIPQLYISNDINDKNPPEMSKENIKFWKTIKYIVVTILTLVIWSAFIWSVKGENPNYVVLIPDYIVSIFNFFGFLFVSIYLLRLTSLDKSIRKSFIRYLFLIGWGIWTILQIWRVSAMTLFQMSYEQINLLGFSTSLCAKGLILLGFYKFSVMVKNYESEKLEEKNKLLEITTEQLEEINDQLKETLTSIQSLSNLINSVSNSNSVEDLASKVVTHLTITNKELFDFDYAIFSEVNYLEQKINYRNSKTENRKIVDVHKWVRTEGFPFEHKDVMAQVYRDRKIIHACGENFDGKQIDLNSADSPLNYEVYSKNNHQDLNRFYIPVLDSKNEAIERNEVLAIIEVGYYIRDIDVKNVDKIKNLHKTADFIKNKAELKLYIDNCAQSYKRISNQIVRKELDFLLEKCDALSKDDHRLYLQKVLKSICDLVNGKFGLIVLFPKSNVSHKPDLFFSDDKLRIQKLQIEDILSECLEINVESANYLKLNESIFSNKIHKLLNMDSIEISKITDPRSISGYLIVFGKNKDFSNNVVKAILTKSTEKFYSTYNKKKFHNTVSSLITPDNAITDLETNLQPLIVALKNYFETPYISIWLRENGDNKENYVQQYATEELKKATLSFNNKTPVNDIELKNNYDLIELNSSDIELFKEFGHRNKVDFLLRKPLKTQHQTFGFIHVYTNKKIDFSDYEDENLMNLISVKALITIQIHNLVNAFSEISISFTQNDLDLTLQKITDTAMNLLNADPVILFKSRNGEDVFFGDVTHSYKNKYADDQIVNLFNNEYEKERHVELAEHIIKDRSKFFNNRDEYLRYIRQHPKVHEKPMFKKDFWEREKIKSLAAVRLEHRTQDFIKPLGIMFINFRNKVEFDTETINLLQTFASFAASIINSGYVFEQNKLFLLSNLRLTQPALTQAINVATSHDAKKTFETLELWFNDFVKQINDSGQKQLKAMDLRGELKFGSDLVNDLSSDFKKIENLYLPSEEPYIIKNVSITKLLKNLINKMQMQFTQQNIKLIDDYSKNNISIDCDERQIELALQNIIKNACQAMNGVKKAELKVSLNKIENGNKIKIEITDNGKGISSEIKDSIFDLYFSYGKSGGSGLGLPMSKYIIKSNHSGVIKGSSSNDETTFTIILPVKQDNS